MRTANQKTSIFDSLKANKSSELRISILNKLIEENKLGNFELNPIQLKKILSLFPEHHLFKALELLVKHFATITLNTKELRNIQLKSTQLISMLSLFHTLNRGIVFETLMPILVNSELTKLKKFELEAAQLKAILFLFSNSDRLKALKLLNENFDIKINLTETDVKELGTCLARDPDFNNLSFPDKKKFWNAFFVKHEKVSDIHAIHHKQLINGINEQNNIARCHQPNNLSKKTEIKNESLELSIKINKRLAREKLNFFKNYVKAQKLQIVFENANEICKFIKLFPPHDAIDFLKLPYIQDQIKNLQQQQKILTKEAYKDLSNYLPENFNKRLLNPISPGTPKRSSAKIFKVSDTDSKYSMPDIIPKVFTRGI